MKVAIIGSRSLTNVDISTYLPENITEIISGGAKGIDSLAEQYADKNGIATKGTPFNWVKGPRLIILAFEEIAWKICHLPIHQCAQFFHFSLQNRRCTGEPSIEFVR